MGSLRNFSEPPRRRRPALPWLYPQQIFPYRIRKSCPSAGSNHDHFLQGLLSFLTDRFIPTSRLLAAITFYAFYTSLGGRPAFGGVALEE